MHCAETLKETGMGVADVAAHAGENPPANFFYKGELLLRCIIGN